MTAIRFTMQDVELIYAMPPEPRDLETILFDYRFLNRLTSPRYDAFRECIDKAIAAGILSETNGKLHASEGWYDRIHMFDDTCANEIDSMLEFADWLISQEFPPRSGATFCWPEDHYTALADRLDSDQASRFSAILEAWKLRDRPE